jgi:hypothetical protein
VAERRLATRLLLGPPVRSTDFPNLHERFLIAAVATILVIRTQLWLTNYPQLGGAGLHIAHLLWGGLFMVVAIGIQLTLLGRRTRRVTAIVGGVGFGFFIDELGKFITADNNYFYRPAAALIYLIFAGLVVLALAFRRRAAFTPRERLANASDLLTAAIRRDLTAEERRQALALLDGADPDDPVVEPLRAALQATRGSRARPTVLGGARSALARRLERLVAWSGFETAVVWLFALWAGASVISNAELVFSVASDLGGAHAGFTSDRLADLEIANAANVASSLVSAAFVACGIVGLVRGGSRQAAYRWFDRALLVAIFLTQVFAFFESQFHAVFGLAIDLALLVALRAVARADEDSVRPMWLQSAVRAEGPVGAA